MKKRYIFWIYIFIIAVLILLVGISFSSPSSEARFETLDGVESGFFRSSGLAAAKAKRELLKEGGICNGDQIRKLTKSVVACPPAFRVTAYCPCDRCCGKWSDGVTASGHIIVKEDAFVAAPSSFAFGTMLKVPGYNNDKPVPVLDRGGVIKGNRLDVFFPTHQEALNWGVKYLKVEVVK